MKNDMRGSVVTERPILKGLLTQRPKRVAFWLTVKKHGIRTPPPTPDVRTKTVHRSGKQRTNTCRAIIAFLVTIPNVPSRMA